MILKIFSPKFSAKKLAFLTQNKPKLCIILIVTLVFEKNANFSAKNCQKSQKFVIITSTNGHPDWHTYKRGFYFFNAVTQRTIWPIPRPLESIANHQCFRLFTVIKPLWSLYIYVCTFVDSSTVWTLYYYSSRTQVKFKITKRFISE
jgi:hypothetical protein